MNAKHSSASNRWFTPHYIIDRVHKVLGGVDLDPASEYDANRTVRATQYYTEGALEKPWRGRVFVHPPGGKVGNKSNTVLFWHKLLGEMDNIEHAIFLAFSIEALQTTQSKNYISMCDFTLCIPSKRIKFVRATGTATSPSHASAIIYVPSMTDNTDAFVDTFSEIGQCMCSGR